MVLDVLIFPDKRLRIKAKPVDIFDDDLQQLVQNMYDTMYAKQGIGLAATQINVCQQVIVMDVPSLKQYQALQTARVETSTTPVVQKNPICLINPNLVSCSGKVDSEEGCLSVPGFSAIVSRHEKITIATYNEKGEAFELRAEGLLAVCIQHEIDHLRGKLFVDYLSKLKFERLRKKYAKIEW